MTTKTVDSILVVKLTDIKITEEEVATEVATEETTEMKNDFNPFYDDF